jgi:N-acyl-D-amino-acid deacylase
VTRDTWTLKGGTIVDGSGGPSYVGDVAIEGDRITSVGPRASSGTVVDVSGCVIAPGFVDIHSHNDWIAPLPDGPALLGPNVQQGITTTVAGNCGLSPAPLGDDLRLGTLERMLLVGYVTDRLGWGWRSVGEYLDVIDERGLPLNLCVFVGHSTLRASAMGNDFERPGAPSELAEMKRLLTEGLQQGAVGLSVGLEYFPGRHAGPSEIEVLSEIVARHDGLTAVHTRGISGLYDRGMAEAIGFAKASRCRLQLSHVAPMGRSNWGEVDKLFVRADEARGAGLDIGLDIVPYTTWTLAAPEVLPHTVQDLGVDAILALTSSDDGRAYLQQKIESSPPTWPPWIDGRVTRNMVLDLGWDAMIVADPRSSRFEPHRGETVSTIATTLARDAFDVYFDVVEASRGKAQFVNVGYGGDLEDDGPLQRVLARPDAIPETDTVPVPGNDGGVHVSLPLFYGTMARFLGRYSRDLGIVPLEEAVARITRVPAERVRLRDRGLLREGAFADVTVFDPEEVGERGTLLDPEPAGGIPHVFVNGEPVVRGGVYDPSRRAGRALRKDLGTRSAR